MATILIIEHRPVRLRFAATLLRDRGHRLLEARSGEEALRIVHAESPDLVIIDILTSGMDGCQFVLNLRSEPNSVQPRIVFRAAAHIAAEGEALATTFGASFIAKPVNPETLLAVVDAALSAQSAPPMEAHSQDKSIDSFLRPIARKLHRHTANLERLNAQLGRGIAQRDAQLEVVRAALDQEIKKRLLAERELTQANLRLKDQVVHDGLTGLHNRRYLEESLGREERRARRNALPLGGIGVVIDHLQ